MKMLKTLTALTMAICMLFCAVEMPYVCANENIGASMKLLNGIGIFEGDENGNLHPEKNVTRAEMAAILMKTMGAKTVGEALSTSFSDMDENHWASGYVFAAVKMGFINGYEDKSFKPDNTVSFFEAVKMIVAALNYEYSAESKGGYPYGYLRVARNLGITDNIKANEHELTRDEVAVMIHNSLGVKFAKVEGESNIANSFLDCLNMEVHTGILSAIYGYNIGGGESLKEDEIIISETRYKTQTAVSKELVGKRVEAYMVKNDNDEYEVLYIGEKSSGEQLVIEASEIDAATSLSEIVYFRDNSKITEKLSGNEVIVYNGKVVNTGYVTDELLRPEQGSVTLMDTDRDGTYDTVSVEAYSTFIVKSIYDDTITDRYGNTVKLEKGKMSDDLRIYRDGKTISAEDIRVNDSADVAVTLDGEIYEVIISTKAIEGEITEVNTSEEMFTLDGEEYEITEKYAAALSEGHNSAKKLTVGEYVVAYLNSFGQVAAIDVKQSSTERFYGFLIGAEENSVLGKNVSFKIMTEENRMETFSAEGKSKIRFGKSMGGNYKVSKVTPSELLTSIAEADGTVKRQIIRYELNAQGEIKALYLPCTEKNDYFTQDTSPAKMYYSNRVFDQKYYVDEDTVVFNVPGNGGIYDDQISAGDVSKYFSSGLYDVELYDIENNHIGMVRYRTGIRRYEDEDDGQKVVIDKVNSPVIIIEKTWSEISDGETYLIIEGYENKKKVQRIVSDTLSKGSTAKDFAVGKVIQYETNYAELKIAENADNDEVIVTYKLLFDCNAAKGSFQEWDYAETYANNARITTFLGKAEDFDAQMLSVRVDNCLGNDSLVLMNVHDGTQIYKYYKGRDKIEHVTAEALCGGQKIFGRLRYNNLREIIILED